MADVVLDNSPSPGPSVPSPGGNVRMPTPPAAPAKPAAPLAPSAAPSAPPKPGTAKAEMFNRLRAKIGAPPIKPADNTPQAPPPSTAAKPEAGNRPDPNKPLQPTPPKPAETPPNPTLETPGAPKTPETPAAPEEGAELTEAQIAEQAAALKGNKTNPWKLVQDYKKKIKQIEQEHAATRRLIADETARKAEVERLEKAEQRAKELEDHIRYVDYSKSNEFKEKYVDPYHHQWTTAMSELAGLEVADENSGEMRKFTPQDMLELVNLPLAQARERANELWGDFADDVMAQRKEIRGLHDKQMAALEDARKHGSEREQQSRVQAERTNAEITKQVTNHFKQANDNMLAHEKFGKYFKPADGDNELNARLEKGYALVDKGFALNPMNPQLSPVQRQEAVEIHAAIRNRCAAFGPMALRIERAEGRVAELEAELAQYRGSTPGVAAVPPGGATPVTGNTMDALKARLRAKAK